MSASRCRALGRVPLAVACNALVSEPGIDLSTAPGITVGTKRAKIGDLYTFSWYPSAHSPQPQRVLSVQVLESRGMRIAGYGVREIGDEGIVGLAGGWPPAGYTMAAIDEDIDARVLEGRVEVAVGVELLATPAAARGLRVRYMDEDGQLATEIADWAFFACSNDCPDSDDVLKQLDLIW